MHISLDSALGRQRRLNSVGESVFQIAPNPSAGYSLRSLTGGDPAVVRVRRASDNSEKDFNSSGVSSGELVNWVNGQVVPPLDVRELVDGERTGALIPAAAAYSLRNLSASYTGDVVEVRRNADGATLDFSAAEVADGTLTDWVNTSFADALPLDTASGAAAAYSLRNLSTSYTDNVVEVRRSSDDTVDSFTAAEVADGTLTDWVNESVSFNAGDIFFSSATTLINESSTAFEATSNGGTFDVRAGGQNYTDIVSGEVTVTFTASNFSSSQSVDFEAWTPTGTATYITAGTITGNGDYTFTFNVTEDGTGSIFRFRGSGLTSGDTLSVSNLSLSYTKASGFVTQWYDQSGNANHATQGTDASQPKIVDAGSLVSGGLDFDGVDDQLDFTALNATDLAIFSVVQFDSVSGQERILGEDSSNSEGFGIGNATTGFFRGNNGSATQPALNATVSTSGTFLYSANRASNTLGFFTQGVASATATNSDAFNANSIGGSTNPVDGKIQEIIIYSSDQSDKRRAIEENIGSNYGITLTSSKDGTVSTWYDQSGNDNHATQGTDASQPKIVDAGSLVSGGLNFDGVDDFLSAGTGFASASKTAFCVNNPNVLNSNGLFGFGSSQVDRFYVQYNLNAIRTEINGANASIAATAGQNLTTHLHTDDISVGLNGSPLTTTTTSFGGVSSTAELRIGQRFGVAFTDNFDGSIKEIIIYNSDQSANRTAFEANIGETYGIDLPSGVDTGYDQVDGFVETWYDQSGNGNDAVQATAGSQPKIVDAGVLVRDSKNNPAIDFDGIDDNMDLTSSLATGGAYSCIAYHEFIYPTMILRGDLNVPRIRSTSNTNYQIGSYTPQVTQNFTVASTLGLVSVLKDASHNARVYANGTESSSGQQNVGSGSRTFTMLGIDIDGAGDGKIVELIYYPSDQSANRVAIETNINNKYDIY